MCVDNGMSEPDVQFTVSINDAKARRPRAGKAQEGGY